MTEDTREAVAREREACAQIAETQVKIYEAKRDAAGEAGREERCERMENYREATQYILDAIRARPFTTQEQKT